MSGALWGLERDQRPNLKRKEMIVPLADIFKLDIASVIGRLHVEKHMNNQDGVSTISGDDFFIAVVSDGCSGSSRSEVGSYLTSTRVAKGILDRLGSIVLCETADELSPIMEEVRLDTSAFLRSTSAQLGPTLHMIMDSMLATAAGFVVTDEFGFFFSIGDGRFFLNGNEIHLNNDHAEYPDMLVYQAIAPESLREGMANRFSISHMFDTMTIISMAVATDGIEYFVKAEGKNFPGRTDVIPSLGALWSPGNNALAMLRKAGKTVYRAQHDNSLNITHQTVERSFLLDDTTIVTLRRA
jgi:serine/threonine protein phosphatase PrpC